MSGLAFLFQFSDQRNIFKNEACAVFCTDMSEIVLNVCPFFIFYPLGLAVLCELKIWIKPEQMYSADTKRPSSELLYISYVLIIWNFFTPYLNMFPLRSELFFQIHMNSVVFRNIFFFLTEMQDDIFMGPGMLNMHSHSVDLFDIRVKPHLTWLCGCMPASIAGPCVFFFKALGDCELFDRWEILIVFFCTEMSSAVAEALKRAFGSGAVVHPLSASSVCQQPSKNHGCSRPILAARQGRFDQVPR